ncbi:MAG TPA: arsenite methyltransferase [Thermoanaerobaculia bacterium]|nr:arsenite methyltransferase [Thermoanaerobaculia bacterium]
MTNIEQAVRERYGSIAREVRQGTGSSCCSPTKNALYANDDVATLPEDAVAASLGCGNPTLLAQLHEGETVLDLGSGGGIDVLLSARRVGPQGKAYGVDMTDDMLELARENQRKAGATNVEFLKGTIEDIPLPDGAVDVIISNCVINLSADKPKVLREAYRVLKPGGRFAVSDIVAVGDMPEFLRKDMEAWCGCISGALAIDEYKRLLAEAGFKDADVELLEGGAPDTLRNVVRSAFIRARKA